MYARPFLGEAVCMHGRFWGRRCGCTAVSGGSCVVARPLLFHFSFCPCTSRTPTCPPKEKRQRPGARLQRRRRGCVAGRTPRKTTAAGGRMGELSDRDDYEVAGGLLPALPAYPARVFPLPARGRHAAGGGARRVVRCAASRRRQADPAASSAALKSPGRWRCAATLPGVSTDTACVTCWSPGVVW